MKSKFFLIGILFLMFAGCSDDYTNLTDTDSSKKTEPSFFETDTSTDNKTQNNSTVSIESVAEPPNLEENTNQDKLLTDLENSEVYVNEINTIGDTDAGIKTLNISIIDEDEEIMTQQPGIGGIITNVSQADLDIVAMFYFSDPFAESETITTFEGIITQGETMTFFIPTEEIPFADDNKTNTVTLKTFKYIEHDSSTRLIPVKFSKTRYYKHDTQNNTVMHFNNRIFREQFNSTLYSLQDGEEPLENGIIYIGWGSSRLSELELDD